MEGVPFLYLGVEDHEHYHRPSDEFEIITRDFFLGAVETAIDMAEAIDERMGETLILEPRALGIFLSHFGL